MSTKLALAASVAALGAAGALLAALRASPSLARLLVGPVLRVRPPHPRWAPGMPQPSPHAGLGFVTVDPIEIGGPACYPLVISGVVPRPIALVSSVSGDGSSQNLAPFSYFSALAHDPPHIAIGLCHTPAKEGRKKDSLANIEQSGEFVVNIMSDWFVEAANHTCGAFDYGVDEMALAGLTPLASRRVKAPRVEESAVQMECKLVHTYDVRNSKGDVSTTIVIGQVLLMHVSEGVVDHTPSGKLAVNFAKLAPMCRLGGNTYGQVTHVFDLPRPDRAV